MKKRVKKLIKDGKYEEAISAFEAMDGYKAQLQKNASAILSLMKPRRSIMQYMTR